MDTTLLNTFLDSIVLPSYWLTSRLPLPSDAVDSDSSLPAALSIYNDNLANSYQVVIQLHYPCLVRYLL